MKKKATVARWLKEVHEGCYRRNKFAGITTAAAAWKKASVEDKRYVAERYNSGYPTCIPDIECQVCKKYKRDLKKTKAKIFAAFAKWKRSYK